MIQQQYYFSIVTIILDYTGTGWINKLFPPAAMGAIVTIIELELASTAADMAGFPVGRSNLSELNTIWVIVSMVTLMTAILTILSATFVVIAENIGHLKVTSSIVGGVNLLLFGSIATSGLRTFIEAKEDFSKSRNLILTSVIFMIGLSGIKLR